jgi:Uma2 family endonuclease
MNRTWPISEIYYPESDGQPMAETPLHQYWMIRLLNLFEQRYAAQPQVFVGSNLMTYITAGDTKDSFAPDLIVLLQSDRRLRRVLKLWEESHPPNLVVEVTSKSTRRKDKRTKFGQYERLGIAEYILFDPEREYLSPPLQGYRLNEHGRYQPIELDRQGRLVSEQTGVVFSLNDASKLLLHDVETGELLLTDAEEAEQRAEKERRAKLAERRAKLAERQAKEAAARQAAAERQAKVAERRAKEAAERQADVERQAKEAERQARLHAEARIAELESEARRLRGE